MICIVCKLPIEDGHHGACVLAIMGKLAAAVAENERLMSDLQDAGILSRRKP